MNDRDSTIAVGDTVHAWMHDRDGCKVLATVAVAEVDKLGCGCLRIRAERPGSEEGHLHPWVALLTGCSWHERQLTETCR